MSLITKARKFINYGLPMKKYLLILSLSLFITTEIIHSQPKILTLEESIALALDKNVDIKVAVMNTEKSRAAVREAFGYALPSVDVSAGFSHFIQKPETPFPDFEALLTNATYNILFNENVIPRDDSKFLPIETKLQSFALSNSYSASVTLSQVLFSSAVFEGIGASQTYYELAKSELNNTVSKTVLSVQQSFYGVLLAKEVMNITNASFVNAQENFDNVKALYGQGMVSEFDYLQAQVRVENIRPIVLKTENLLKTAKDGLKIVIGLNQTEDIDVSGEIKLDSIDISNEDELILEALNSNFDIQSLELKKQVDKAFIQLDVSDYWPTISAFGNYTYAGSSDKWNFQNYDYSTIGLNLSFNLWRGNRTKNAVEQSTITYKQTEEQLAQLKDYTTLNVKSKILELKRVKSLIDVQERTVNLAERSYHIAKVRYQEGAGSQLELQNADQDLSQARLNKVEAIHSYLITKFELDQLLGRTNPQYFNSFKED
jgi:outer membrane protein TolC